MGEALRYFFLESHARWLLYILTFELFVALTISPTILTDYRLANYFVEVMSFLDVVHAYDEAVTNPEAVSFFIALSFFLFIPKVFAWYLFFIKTPYSQLAQFVITPYTKYKPNRTLGFFEMPTEEEAKEIFTIKRSMFSRIIWSLLSLLIAIGIIWMQLKVSPDIRQVTPISKNLTGMIAAGDIFLWFSVAIYITAASALMMNVIYFICRDYCLFTKELTGKVFSRFK